MTTEFKKFEDLHFKMIRGRYQATLLFDNGYGVQVTNEVKSPESTSRYTGVLQSARRVYSGDTHLLYRQSMTVEEVTEYMKEIQEIK